MGEHYDRYNGMDKLLGTNLAEVGTSCSEFPNNSDAISRQAAIDAMFNLCDRLSEPCYRCENPHIDVIVDELEQLPSAQPEIFGKGNDMDKTDSAIHELFRAIKKKDIKWNDFPSIGLSESYYLWYYAENRLYIIMDVMTNGIYFIEARNPTEAFRKLVARLDEAMKAGEIADEEYDELF